MSSEPRPRVLLVEDDLGVSKAFTRILTELGADTLRATSAEGALQIAAAEPALDLVLCDIGLPGNDGLSFLRAFHAQKPHVPVLLMTGGPTIDSAIKAVEYGAFRYLTKPIDIAVLREAIVQGLKLRRLAELQREAKALREKESPGLAFDELDRGLDDAIAQLWMAYQPIVSWKERRVFAFEALARTRSLALSNPAAMFDAAERLRRVHELSRAVRAKVAADVSALPEGVLLFVNLHPLDLLDERLFGDVLHASASRVVLEITERLPLTHIDEVAERLQRLRDCGYRLALDDLGSGYSGLVSFTQFEPAVVKLDMALTRDIHASATKQKLVRSMRQLCDELAIITVAEGIETAAERDALLALGCDLQQGYLFAKPAPPFSLPAF